jgi:hypothetical protein
VWWGQDCTPITPIVEAKLHAGPQSLDFVSPAQLGGTVVYRLGDHGGEA